MENCIDEECKKFTKLFMQRIAGKWQTLNTSISNLKGIFSANASIKIPQTEGVRALQWYYSRFHHVSAHTWLGPHDWAHMTVPRHGCAQTRLCPDTIVPRHDCAHTRLCPDTIVPRHDCAQTRLCPDTIVPRHDCAQTWLCPYVVKEM